MRSHHPVARLCAAAALLAASDAAAQEVALNADGQAELAAQQSRRHVRGREARRQSAAGCRAQAGTTPPVITWPGFQMQPDGSSRVFVQVDRAGRHERGRRRRQDRRRLRQHGDREHDQSPADLSEVLQHAGHVPRAQALEEAHDARARRCARAFSRASRARPRRAATTSCTSTSRQGDFLPQGRGRRRRARRRPTPPTDRPAMRRPSPRHAFRAPSKPAAPPAHPASAEVASGHGPSSRQAAKPRPAARPRAKPASASDARRRTLRRCSTRARGLALVQVRHALREPFERQREHLEHLAHGSMVLPSQ